jgi:hypothetical protein
VVFHDYCYLKSYFLVASFVVHAFQRIYNHDETEVAMDDEEEATDVPLLLQALSVDAFQDERVLQMPEEGGAQVVAAVHILRTLMAEEQEATREVTMAKKQFVPPPKQLLLQLKHMQQHDHAFVLHNIVPWPLLDAVEEGAIDDGAGADEHNVAVARPLMPYLPTQPTHLAEAPRFQREDPPF